MAQDITTVKINELATSAINSSDYFVKADANGIAYKNTLTALANFIGGIGVSGYVGVISTTGTPPIDGFYFARESGTYTNAGGLVVDLNNGLNIISVTGNRTVFNLIVIPLDLSSQLVQEVTDGDIEHAPSSNAVYNHVDLVASDKISKQTGANLLDPAAFRYGEYYFRNNDPTLIIGTTARGTTDFIKAIPEGLVSEGTARDSDGMCSYIVFDENKNFIRSHDDSDQYTYVSGDAWVKFEFMTGSDLNFAKTKAVLAGTVYEFEEYYEYKPVYDLQQQVNALGDITVASVKNGDPVNYGNVSDFGGNGIIERNVPNDYMVFGHSGTGNVWCYTPVFVPTGENLVHIKFNAEFTKVGTEQGISLWVADESGTSGFFQVIQVVDTDGDYDITFDPAFYTVYEGVTQFYVWIRNNSMLAGQSMQVKLTGLRVEEYNNAVDGINISGGNSKELFESTDAAISNMQQLLNEGSNVIAPDGTPFKIGITNAGVLTAIPVIPDSGYFFGNSLLAGFGSYGMAASAFDKDYYYLISEYIKTLNPSFTYGKTPANSFEAITDPLLVDVAIQSTFIDNLTGLENLVVIQLGDNVNTPTKLAVFQDSALKLLQAIRNHCPNSRVIWMGMWYGTAEKYDIIREACVNTGSTFISFDGLISSETRSAIGNLTEIGNAVRVLSGVTNVIENTATNITVTFNSGGSSYQSTLDVDSYVLNVDELTYTSNFEIISSGGVASHPGDEGFRLIANRFIYESRLSTNEEVYP